jgi:CheY-like chemotaxis protein
MCFCRISSVATNPVRRTVPRTMVQEATILLAEDDPNDVLLMKRAFSRARLANPLKVVPDGEEAIAYLSGQGLYADRERYPFPLLVLLDLKMPKRNGIEVLEWIRNQPELKDLSVVVLTSSEEQPNIQKAASLGASSYLIKPAEFEDLVEMMRRLQGYWLLINRKAERMALLVEE